MLESVDLAIEPGRFTSIVGPSGSGKSSLLRLLDRLDVPTEGTVRLDGVDLAELDPLALRRRVAMVFQAPVVFTGTVAENLTMVPLAASVRGEGDQRDEPAADLARVGLPAALLDRDAAVLSGGEAQRLTLARALRTGPDVVLADEVTASLDGESAMVIEELLVGLVRQGATVVAVSHDPDQVLRLADRAVVLVGGRLRAAGPPAELLAHDDPAVRLALGAS